MPKDLGAEVRAGYELRPYPAVNKATLRRPRWLLPPLDWIYAVAQPAEFPPQRILVAGCGTGLEAFALRRRFPRAEIIGVDFSAESLRIARRLQEKSARSAQVRFVRADLTNDRFDKLVGRDFDFVSCHGVMSYLPAPARAFRNLARSLAPAGVLYLGANGATHFSKSWRRLLAGVLYLGVNGATHFSKSWRRLLAGFGFEMERWPGGERLWRHLRLCATLSGDSRGRILRHGAGYLASDLFGPVIRNLPLARWVQMCGKAGLHFRGSHSAQQLLRPAINEGSHEFFLPRSRGETAELLEKLWPRSFHQLIFTRQPERVPPWRAPAQLLKWRPLWVKQARPLKWPTRRGTRLLKIENRSSNTSIELRAAQWEIDLFRASNGERSLREILAPVDPTVPAATLRSRLYLFYQLNLLNFLPPGS